MKRLCLIPFILLLSAFISCKDEDSLILVPTETTDSYEKSLERWEGNGYHNYRYEFRWRCFCTRINDWVEVTVRNDTVFRIVNLESEEAYENEWAWQREDFRTIDGLFDLIREARDKPADSITAAYDASKGFPVKVDIDWNRGLIDEEIGFEIRKVIVE